MDEILVCKNCLRDLVDAEELYCGFCQLALMDEENIDRSINRDSDRQAELDLAKRLP